MMLRNLRERLGELKLRKRDGSGLVFISVYGEAETLWLLRLSRRGELEEHELLPSQPDSTENWAREASMIWPDLTSENAEYLRA